MNKRQIVASLNSIANELDSNGLFKEANVITSVMVKISQSSGGAYIPPPNSLGAFFNGPEFIKSIEDQAKKDIKQKIDENDIAGAKKIYIETFKKLKDPSNFIREVSPTINDPSVPIASLQPMPPFDLVPDSPKPSNTTPVAKPKPSVSNKPSQPSSKPGMSSKPGTTNSSTPKSVEGLDRWVNKAENIYNAWGSKGARPSTDAMNLVKDIIDYMDLVKSNLPTSLHSAADAKIDRVREMMQNIFDGVYNPALALTPLPYGVMSGYPSKGFNPFETGKRMQEKDLKYQARNEGKSY